MMICSFRSDAAARKNSLGGSAFRGPLFNFPTEGSLIVARERSVHFNRRHESSCHRLTAIDVEFFNGLPQSTPRDSVTPYIICSPPPGLLPNPDFFAGPRMLDVHVPHKSEHTWTDFIIHIATITVGLFIAVGLEQTVEHFHHLHQRHQLEEDLRDELRTNLERDAEDFRIFSQIRAYTVELKSAVSARRTSAASPPAPPAANDTRRQQIPIAPSIAIWEAAKLDATIPLLPSREIDLFNGVVLQHTLTFNALDDFQHAAFALESFEERFSDSPGAFDMGYPAPPPPLGMMSAADLAQYEALLAAYIKAVDRLTVRLHFFDRVARGILDGATDRKDLSQRAFPGHKPPSLDVPSPIEGSPQP